VRKAFSVFVFWGGIQFFSAMFLGGQLQAPAILSMNQFAGLGKVDLHTTWTVMLKKFVSSNGNVRYSAWKKDQQALQSYLKKLASLEPLASQSRDEQIAYWINLYNASTVHLLLQHYPVKSMQDIASGKPWDIRFIRVGSKTFSLNDIEHSILRKRFRDARIHFTINCASKSCPPLKNSAYQAENLENQLTDATLRFLLGRENTISPDRVELSKLFEWYRQDFEPLIDFISKYSSVNIKADAQIHFREYDWSLNE
jgi:hypothetical protein